MPWIKLADNAPRHPKVAALSDRAFRVWIQSLCYAAEFLTDGVLPWAYLDQVPARVHDELIGGGLWRNDGPRIRIHDYLAHQTSKAMVEAERQRNLARRTGGVPAVYRRGTGKKPRPEDRSTEVSSSPPVRPPAKTAENLGDGTDPQ
ncbi:MAG: hypothetical protein EHM91_00120 [Planctomycetota bacterium]|nr:MAG: hypothetical protein EHM91_00120 [Planctomycetota bacterium]